MSLLSKVSQTILGVHGLNFLARCLMSVYTPLYKAVQYLNVHKTKPVLIRLLLER